MSKTHAMRPANETFSTEDEEKTAMVCRMLTIFMSVVVFIVILSTAAFAAEIMGTVSAVNEKGMATIKTTDGKELTVQMAGVKVGDKVDCHPKGGKMSCHTFGPKHK
jgi:hypothetical protein